MELGGPVLVWIGGRPGEGLPIGARVVNLTPLWLDICSMGQHLPQMYREAETAPLDAEAARAHGLCPDCLGYGTLRVVTEVVVSVPGVDQVEDPCTSCGGTGRPHLRVTIERDLTGGAVGFTMETIEHRPVVLPGRPDMCMACGHPPVHPQAKHLVAAQ